MFGKRLIILKARLFYKKIEYMQNRFKVQYQAFLSKIEILITYWDKTIGKIMNFSIKSKDPKVALLVR